MATTQIKGNQIYDKTITDADITFSGTTIAITVVPGDYFMLSNDNSISKLLATGSTIVNLLPNYFIESIKSGFNITLGGVLSVSSTGYVLWTNRYLVMSNGNSSDFATTGYFYIETPLSGTITGVGGATNVTATTAGVPLSDWQALYYILPTSSGATSLNSNFVVSSYSYALNVPYNWIQICMVNGANHVYFFPNGVKLNKGQSIDLTLNDSVNSANLGGQPSSYYMPTTGMP